MCPFLSKVFVVVILKSKCITDRMQVIISAISHIDILFYYIIS